jgi:acetolactate synthase-1/2/3 large subunit
VTTHSTAHYLLEGLCEIGVDYLFGNLGTDHAPIVEEMARWKRLGRRTPQVILCPHESVAIHMAGGYAMATGRGQAVLVHVDAGTANAAMGMHNFARGRVPLLLFAGRAPFTLHGQLPGSRDAFVHFLQDNSDQASLVRPYAKWCYDLPSGVIAKEVLHRADMIMHSDGMGPVYLTAAREILAAHHDESEIRVIPKNHRGAARLSGLDDETAVAIADRLMAAERPILITSYAGRNPHTPGLIERLATLAGMRVYESHPIHLNVSRTARCFAGFMASRGVPDADFGLLLDVDVPWLPKRATERPGSFWAHIDVDIVKKEFPLWEFPGDIRVQADSRRALERLIAAVEAKATPAWRRTAQARLAQSAQAQVEPQRTDARSNGPLTAAQVGAALAAAIDDDAVLVQEAVTNFEALNMALRRSRPGTFFSNGGGGLGFGGGAALGIKLAHPDRLVIHVTGDGSFCFSVPSAVLAVAKRNRLPCLTVILDNSGWAAVKGATKSVYPAGEAVAANSFHATFADDLRWDKIVEVSGAHGERVERPDELAAAIARCLAAVREGRAAVLVAALESVEGG